VQSVKDLATAAGFSASAITGNEADAPQIDEVREADLEFLVRGCEKKLVGFDLVAEGMLGESEVLTVHVNAPFDS
jgi:hypothetical protein